MGFLMMEKLRITPFGVAFIILDKKTQERFDYRRGESEGFVNMPLSIADVRMSIFLTQEDGDPPSLHQVEEGYLRQQMRRNVFQRRRA